MEVTSSGEDVILKARKPYTITKQRERWSEEEHNRFLEAIKLYGRAWQRIAEHIGTKTAVQIRSHAQKFFTKLEKAALVKGVPLSQAIDIDIPPPRPKRKPCSPYPRKSSVSSPCPVGERVDDKPLKSASSASSSKHLLDNEGGEAQEMPVENETLQRSEEASADDSCYEVLNLFRDCPSSSISYVTHNPSSSGNCREFMPVVKTTKENIALDEPSLCTKLDNTLHKDRSFAYPATGRFLVNTPTLVDQSPRVDVSNESEEEYIPMKEKKQDDQLPPAASNHSGPHASSCCPSVNTAFLLTPNGGTYSELSSIHQPLPTLRPFNHFQSNTDAYRPFENISSNLSDLIANTLLQNPAVYTAASLAAAASFWPPADVDSSNESMITERSLNPSVSTSAIAAATVAAASAWWATQGMLPLCPPIHPGLTFSPVPVTIGPVMERARHQEYEDVQIRLDGKAQNPAQDDEALIAPTSKLILSSPSSLSESDGSEGQISCFPEFKTSNLTPVLDTGINSSAERLTKKLDSSSGGSNIPSSSEVETDAMLKYEGVKHEPEQGHSHYLPDVETNNRRSRSSGNINESWKEVTEEGRVAFRALFNGDVLPQSFSGPQMGDTKTHTVTDLCDQGLVKEKLQNNVSLLSVNRHGPIKATRGFKPYKRCSVEANENIVSAGEESSSKRSRLEGDTST